MDDVEPFEVEYDGERYEISSFMKNHPGGVNYLEAYKNKDVKTRMKNLQHSKSAMYLLREYKIGGRDNNNYEINDELEKLVDWSKPILHQVADLGPKYSEWVVLPVDREIRLFSNPILESLSITPWYSVLIVGLPLLCYYYIAGRYTYLNTFPDSDTIFPTVYCILLGLTFWSLFEYSMHRWLFHMMPSGRSRFAVYVHFIMHGLHHKAPFDDRRLVIPPFPVLVLEYVLFNLLSIVIPDSVFYLVATGIRLGYMSYDLIHYYLHHASPEQETFFYHMKRTHYHHHFSSYDKGYGVSNPMWDYVFGTVIKLRKLGMGIKWCKQFKPSTNE